VTSRFNGDSFDRECSLRVYGALALLATGISRDVVITFREMSALGIGARFAIQA
jgi:hypothetical protein